METLDDLLAKHSFFQGLKAEDLKLIAGCGSNVHFEPGEFLFREGDQADRFYALREGSAVVEIHVPQAGPVVIQSIGPGEILGWSWLFPPYRWQFDARAREGIRATVFDGQCLRTKCESNPALGYELMKRLAFMVSQRLEATRLQLLDIYAPGRQ
jgi:CRP/FNR family transcriptional regulator, cyclic AMP receptor protein